MSEILNNRVSDQNILNLVKAAFKKIAPFWPLQNLIAVNPLQGFEDLPIEEALKLASVYFAQTDIPKEILTVNIETIKWLQAYCDEGQATLKMPLREKGFYNSWRKLAVFDEKLHHNINDNIIFLQNLPHTADQAISQCLSILGIKESEQELFLSLLLSSLSGWSALIKYKTEWTNQELDSFSITQIDYVAVRLVIAKIKWPEAKNLINWHYDCLAKPQNNIIEKLEKFEKSYREDLLNKIIKQEPKETKIPDAQLIFCIDVRSEPFRKALESTGNYHTFGFAGFFGIPAQISNKITGNTYSSCPVLLKPKHEIPEIPVGDYCRIVNGYNWFISIKRLYQSLKYTFSTPFALVETLGGFSGIWMGLKTITPQLASRIKSFFINSIFPNHHSEPCLDSVSFAEKCSYAESALRMIGLTNSFSKLIVFCGHGSSTENNAYASSLDCGACGGRHGGSNAKILAAILNDDEVRSHLKKNGINIPKECKFFAAEHNTTTDEVKIFTNSKEEKVIELKQKLEEAKILNNQNRLKKLSENSSNINSAKLRSQDWAQVRPEWGLARNAAFIVAPRKLTASLDLEGRCFLHSYDYKADPEGELLTNILTAPMVVAEWINMQYLFSTIDNSAYGGGSKITKNITGKIAIMQGNASDLMTGLPLQSVYKNHKETYHEPQRLMTLVSAPKDILNKIIKEQPILQKLFGNGWVQLAILDPEDKQVFLLGRDFSWQRFCDAN